MPSERVRKCFADIKNAIDLIIGWSGQAGGAELAMGDVLVRSGIERQLLIVSEAAIRLDKLDPTITQCLAPEIDWPGVRGIGNFIRHKYDDLDTQIIVDAHAHGRSHSTLPAGPRPRSAGASPARHRRFKVGARGSAAQRGGRHALPITST